MTKVSQNTPQQISVVSWTRLEKTQQRELVKPVSLLQKLSAKLRKIDILQPLKQWLDNLDIRSSTFAHKICQTIPAQCPFERDVKFLGRLLFHIPPMCKLNPVYDELVGLRFRALCFLVDECGEDISAYC